MNITAGISIILYYLAFILYYRHLLPVGRKRIWMIVPALLLPAAAYYVVYLIALPWLHLPVLFIAMTFGAYLCTGMSFMQALYGAGVCTLSLYCFRGITTSLGAWIVQDTLPGFALDSQSYYGLTVVSLLIALIVFQILRKTALTDQDIRMFLSEPGSIKNVIVYELAAIPCLILLNEGRHHTPNALWFTGITLAGCGFILLMLFFSIYHSIKETRLLRYKLRNRFAEEQMETQLRYYNSYHKNTEKFRKLKHDYLSVMRTLKAMLEEGQSEQSLALIHETYASLQELNFQYGEYSENATLNAVLQDLELNCKEHGIRFSCEAMPPRSTELTTLEALRIITNIINNAVEACKRIPLEERFIKMISRNKNGWAMLHVVNGFDGNIRMEHGQLKSRKHRQADHGLGLSIVKDIVEEKGGFLMTEYDLKTNTFETTVLVPQCLPAKDRSN